MIALLILLGALSGALFTGRGLVLLLKGKEEYSSHVIGIYGFIGLIVGAMISTYVVGKHLAVLNWLIVPIAGFGTVIAIALCLAAIYLFFRLLGVRNY